MIIVYKSTNECFQNLQEILKLCLKKILVVRTNKAGRILEWIRNTVRCSNVIEKVFLSTHTVCSTHFTFIFSIVDHDHTNLKAYQNRGDSQGGQPPPQSPSSLPMTPYSPKGLEKNFFLENYIFVRVPPLDFTLWNWRKSKHLGHSQIFWQKIESCLELPETQSKLKI